MTFFKNHKIISSILVVVLPIVGFVAYRVKGPHRFYAIDVVMPAPGDTAEPGVLEVGVAMRDITPDLDQYDTWTDANNDGRFKPEDGDTYQDTNGNGSMDLVWLGGFANNRPATGVNDKQWTRAIAFRNNGVTLVMVTIDSVGITYENFIAIRKSLDKSLGIDHVMFSSTHSHSTPDTMGIWSYSILPRYYDFDYIEMIRDKSKEAIEEAVRNLELADMYCAPIEMDPEGFVDDSRKPVVYDKTIINARFVTHNTDDTIATLVSWGNHPEVLDSKNTLLTSDFPHYWRESVQYGVDNPGGADGFEGMCLFFQGNVGGLMTPLHTTVPHRDGQQEFAEATFEKAEALGDNLALLTLRALRSDDAWKVEKPVVAFSAKTIYVPLDGLFKYAIMLGLVHPGYYWGKAKSEVNAIRVGDLEIVAIPGELYPEISDGGIESPEGADFGIAPLEVPPLRELMTGKMKMVSNLANDEVGYIVPKSQWDVDPPFAYGLNKAQYGEVNSGGPDVAQTIHREAAAVIERLHEVCE